jgi:hypothetical protein
VIEGLVLIPELSPNVLRNVETSEADLSKAQSGSADIRKRLCELVEYVEELVKQADRPVFKLTDYDNLLYYEADLKGQIGVHHDLEDGDGPIWLKIDRLRRLEPPAVPESIREWLTISRDPFREPVIESSRVETMPRDEAAKLVARGLTAKGDVQPNLKAGKSKDLVDVILRIERFKEIKAAGDSYVGGPWREWSEGREAAAANNCNLRRLFQHSASY